MTDLPPFSHQGFTDLLKQLSGDAWPMDLAAFDAKPCECGHLYGRHPWQDNPRSHGYCLDCECRQRRDAVAAARYRRQQAIAADPSHVHGSTHTAYACPGFVPIQLCDDCGSVVPS